MAAKKKSGRPNTSEPAQVVRQFAWHLAGIIAASATKTGTQNAATGPSDKR